MFTLVLNAGPVAKAVLPTGKKQNTERGGVHAVGTLLKHLNIIAGHTFSKRESKSLIDRIREEMRHKEPQKKKKRESSVPAQHD